MKKKIFITGATGFIGSEIVKQLLKKDYIVRALKRENSNIDILRAYSDKIEWIDGDVLDIISLQDGMKGVDEVYHAAAMISFVPAEKKKMYKVNIEGTSNVVNIALESNVKKLLFVSSISAFGRYEIKEEITEQKKWINHKDNTHYAISKHQSELEVWRGIEEGLSAVIVNPSTVLGYGDWTKGSCQIFKQVYDKVPFYPSGINGFVGVEDVAKCSVLLMDSSINSKRFIINAENVSYKNLFEWIAEGFNVSAPKKAIPLFVRKYAWVLYWIKSKLMNQQALITKETMDYTARNYFYNNEAIKKATGITFKPIKEIVKGACIKYKEKVSSTN